MDFPPQPHHIQWETNLLVYLFKGGSMALVGYIIFRILFRKKKSPDEEKNQ